MVGLFQKDRGVLARLIGEIVPLGAALALGSLLAPVVGPLGGAPLLLLAWALLSAVLVRVRRHPWLRRIYRGAVVAHIVFWAILGWRGAALDGPREPVLVGVLTTDAARPLRAGYGEAAFELPADTTLAGWGMRPRRINLPAFGGFGALGQRSLAWMGRPTDEAAHRRPLFRRPDAEGDALGARAVLLRSEGGSGVVAFVRLDLIVMEQDVADAILERTTALGLDASTLIVTATHTHSAPGGVSRASIAQVVGTDHADRRVFDAVVDAGVRALDRAAQRLRLARLTFRDARDRGADGRPLLAKTRGVLGDEDPAGDAERVDDRVLLMQLDALDGTPIAVLLNYAIQPVVVRPRELLFARDLAGALEDAFQDALPGRPPVVFLNGHCGDVTPRRGGARGREAAAAVAARFAASIAKQLDSTASPPASARVRIEAAGVRRDFGTPRAFVAVGRSAELYAQLEAGGLGRSVSEGAATMLALPANLALWTLTLTEARLGFTFSGAAGTMVNLEDHVLERDLAVGAIRLTTPGESRLLLWHPAVGTQALGKALRTRFGEPTPFLLGFANGACGYLTTESEYARGGYEARSSLYGPAGGQLLEEALAHAVDALNHP